jgi:methylenetetrahydrofolate reductase (NADPH)
MRAGGRLERVLRAGLFAVTAELNPPDTTDPQEIYEAAIPLAEVVDAINTIDSSGANVHMSSLGVSALLLKAGYDVDADVLLVRIFYRAARRPSGLLLREKRVVHHGDDVSVGDHPETKRVFDLAHASAAYRRIMRDQGVFLSGRKISIPPALTNG